MTAHSEGSTKGVVQPDDRTMPEPVTLSPYIFFYGRCREALDFYARVLGGTYDVAALQDDGTIMHAWFKAPGIGFNASDGGSKRAINPDEGNITLCLNVSDPAKAQATFDALVDGGTIVTPFGDAMWGGKFGALHDRFGNEWFVVSQRSNG